MSSDVRAERLGTDPLGPLILRFSLPVIANLVVNALYNLVDRVFVGRAVGAAALAGITVAFPLFIVIAGVGMLFGAGAASVISISLGRRDRARAEAAAGTGLRAAAAAAAVMAVAGHACLRPLLVAFGGSGEVLLQAERFAAVALVGGVFQVVAMTLAMIIRSAGDPAAALRIALAGTALNLVLNPLFLFGLRLGVAGSALATALAEAASCGLALAYFRRGHGALRLRPGARSPGVLRELLALGAGPFAMQVALTAVAALSNRAVAVHGGPDAIAVMGIAYVVYPLVLLPVAGLGAGVQPVLGYNAGAGQGRRVRRALRLALAAATAFCTAAWIGVEAFAGPLVRLFVRDAPGVVAVGAPALRLFFALLPLVGVQLVGAGYLQAVGRAGLSLLANLARYGLCLPLLLVLPPWLGVRGVWLGSPLSEACATALVVAVLAVDLRRGGAPGAAAAGPAPRGNPAARLRGRPAAPTPSA